MKSFLFIIKHVEMFVLAAIWDKALFDHLKLGLLNFESLQLMTICWYLIYFGDV